MTPKPICLAWCIAAVLDLDIDTVPPQYVECRWLAGCVDQTYNPWLATLGWRLLKVPVEGGQILSSTSRPRLPLQIAEVSDQGEPHAVVIDGSDRVAYDPAREEPDIGYDMRAYWLLLPWTGTRPPVCRSCAKMESLER